MSGQFGTSAEVSRGHLVPKCLADTSALILNCLDLQQTFLLQKAALKKGLILLVIIIKEDRWFTVYTRIHRRGLATIFTYNN